MMGWIGVDLDGTIAEYDTWKGEEHIGNPIPTMVFRVKKWLLNGVQVKIMTARFHNGENQIRIIKEWCKKHIGVELEVTATKDFQMYQLWDDRAVRVKENTGEVDNNYKEN